MFLSQFLNINSLLKNVLFVIKIMVVGNILVTPTYSFVVVLGAEGPSHRSSAP